MIITLIFALVIWMMSALAWIQPADTVPTYRAAHCRPAAWMHSTCAHNKKREWHAGEKTIKVSEFKSSKEENHSDSKQPVPRLVRKESMTRVSLYEIVGPKL